VALLPRRLARGNADFATAASARSAIQALHLREVVFGTRGACSCFSNFWLPAITESAARLGARSFTIDGEAVVIGPDGLTDFEALRRQGAGDLGQF
jgi:hypothetical protein